MAKIGKYKVCVLGEEGYKYVDLFIDDLSYEEAVDRFLFYVLAALEDNLSLRFVNIMLGNKTIKLFENRCCHGRQ